MEYEKWIKHTEFLNNSDDDINICNSFHVDTRDFHIIGNSKELDSIKLKTIFSLPDIERFHLTLNEIKTFINYCYEGSGGELEWRELRFEKHSQVQNFGFWNFKYLRFFKISDNIYVMHYNKEIFIVGGKSIYEQFEKENVITKIYHTIVNKNFNDKKPYTLYTPNTNNFKLIHNENLPENNTQFKTTFKIYCK